MIIADLHIHSRYSRATSRDCTPESLDAWARQKGIGLVGTGDFTHPAWREELREKLQPAEEGLYVLKEDFRREVPVSSAPPRFVVTGEISSIYKKNGKVRKVHSLILLPSLEAAQALAHRLEQIGNLHSDGRPILGLDCHDLLEITLECCPEAVFIPAHIWTPHFSLFGAFSGFDSIEECFDDLTPHIHALETGLSSDPPMNWRLSALDSYTLVSNSDAHSPSKLGREANLLNIDLSYPALKQALEAGKPGGFCGTIEFFPEEGKYHLDGHRKCGVCLQPSETLRYGGKCPVCGRKLTIGVQHRVEALADRAEGFSLADAPVFESLAPLPEVIAASTNRSATSVKVQAQYQDMISRLGPEFTILRQASLGDIRLAAGPCIAEGIRRLRAGEVKRIPGYDGAYGIIRLLEKWEVQTLSGQLSFFRPEEPAPLAKHESSFSQSQQPPAVPANKTKEKEPEMALDALNSEQQAAVTASEPVVAVIAGPGTGKTKTLISRIAYLIEEAGVPPKEITAVTFTNKAAQEMRQRLGAALGKRTAQSISIGTFHHLALQVLRRHKEEPFCLISPYDAREIASEVVQTLQLSISPRQLLQDIARMKNNNLLEPSEAYTLYQQKLKALGALDFDDLLLEALASLKAQKDAHFTHLLVDEFQDIDDIQYRLIQTLLQNGKSLFVIGDPDQSIYGFRGASAQCFERLAADYPQLRLIRLLKNYRSTPQILASALPVISQNPGPDRLLHAQRPDGRDVRLVSAQGELSQAIFVAKEISRMVGGMDMLESQNAGADATTSRTFSDIAILYRTHRQADRLEKCLARDGIPYLVAGREDFLDDPYLRGTVGFFRFLENPRDFLSLRAYLRNILNCPKEVPEEVLAFYQSAGPLFDTQQATSIGIIGDFLPSPSWGEDVADFGPRLKKDKPAALLKSWAERHVPTDPSAMERLLEMAALHRDMGTLLETLLLGQERDLERTAKKNYVQNAVTLLTLHGSKGLEFPVVFLAGVDAGCLPLEGASYPTDLEEERRLLFVGMTRAKEELYLLTSGSPSTFLEDIPAPLLSREQAPLPRQSHFQQLTLFEW